LDTRKSRLWNTIALTAGVAHPNRTLSYSCMRGQSANNSQPLLSPRAGRDNDFCGTNPSTHNRIILQLFTSTVSWRTHSCVPRRDSSRRLPESRRLLQARIAPSPRLCNNPWRHWKRFQKARSHE
jgi:hypothetical protein